MKEKKAIFIINILKNIIDVYFDTFFVFYFFKVANYEVLPLAKYYLTLYLFCAIGFFLIRKPMKKNIKVHYFRIGISLQAIYISLIMLLKDNIINYVYLVGILRGIANGFYHYPKNILNTEKITNDDRQKFEGITNIFNKIVAILVPLILGVALTYISYTNLGKIFFVLFIVLFIISFFIRDYDYNDKKFEMKKLFKVIQNNINIRYSMFIIFLQGLTYQSGVLGTIITLSKINVFKTNLNLGFVDSLCALVYLLVSIIYTAKIKKKQFPTIMITTGVASFIILVLLGFKFSATFLIIYLLIRNSLIGLMHLISDNTVVNLSNSEELKKELKPEYYFIRDAILGIARCIGYSILLIVAFTLGMDYINYILIIPAISLLIESILIAKVNKNTILKEENL